MKKVELVLIGLGYMGKIHLKNCLSLKSAKLIAVADSSKKELKYAEELGVKKTYSNFQEMIEKEDADAVIIALPTFLHEESVRVAAENGMDIFLEKPLARNIAEGEAILKSIKKQGVKLMVGYPNRFYRPFKDLKREIEEGVYGDIQTANASIIGPGPFLHRIKKGNPQPVPEWWFNKELTGGGALIDLGCHVINLLRWYFGDVGDVKCILGYRFNLDVEDHAICYLKFKSGTMSTINTGWFTQKSILKLELYGTVNHAIRYRKTPNLVIEALKQLFNMSDFYSLFKVEIEYFANCIVRDENPDPSAEEGLADLMIIERAYKSSLAFDNVN